MKETRTMEFKETVTNTFFLKTVSAFSNYNGGMILLALMIMVLPKGYQMKSNHVWILKIKLTIVFTLNQTIHLRCSRII